MNRHATGHRRRRSRASCAIVAFMMLLSLWGGMSWNMQEASAASRFDKIMDPELPSDFDADDTTNPYKTFPASNAGLFTFLRAKPLLLADVSNT